MFHIMEQALGLHDQAYGCPCGPCRGVQTIRHRPPVEYVIPNVPLPVPELELPALQRAEEG